MKLKINIKKILKFIIIILLLITFFLIIREICMRYDGKLDKSNPMSRDEVLKLVEKGNDCPNYTLTYLANSKHKRPEQKIYRKDNLIKGTIDGKAHYWMNYDTGEVINKEGFPFAHISNAYNTKLIRSKEEYFEENKSWTYESIKNTEAYDYEYLGEREFNGRETILIKLIDIKYEKNSFEKVYIDKKTGFEVKRDSFYYDKIWHILKKYSDELVVEFDNVTDEDVKRPNIAGDIVIDYREDDWYK